MDSPTGIDPDARIGRVTLTVSDLDAVLPFYRDAVGLRVRERRAGRAVLGTADAGDLLVLEESPGADPRPPDAAGLFHTAFLFPSRAALGDALARVRDAGVGLTGASDHRVSEALYLRDPEDNGVELYRDRPREEWPESGDTVEMDTLRLDVDALLADRAGGADSAGDAAPAGTTVGHVHLEVTDLGAAETFYVDTVGFDVRQRMGTDALFVAAGGYHHHLGLNTWNRRTAPASGTGLTEFEVIVPDAGGVASVRESVAAAGVDVRDDGDGFVAAAPDGVRVRLSTA
ncbi:VOC family protein [Halobaculum gomorrense]|uniref:Catechol 2,3-dioxygenase n=1 Tax=Halobaculum gomorrense TaxID=43928 RepID=A0A1M5TKE2_9EURY|nr:VOC family protein [Halobaculum gomorrense]SHH51237.1 catechol 2,3-dioxygenase [Halobaculum gomorrense]